MLIYGISKVYVEKSTGRRISGHRAALTSSFQFWHLEFPMTLGILCCHWQNHFFFFLSTQSVHLITCRTSKEVDAKTLQLVLSILSASSKIVGLRSVCYFTSVKSLQSLQSCLTLCDPIDRSPPGSPIPGILQARTLEWVAIPFSNAWKWKVKVKSISGVRLLVTPWTAAYQAPPSVGFSRQEQLKWVAIV